MNPKEVGKIIFMVYATMPGDAARELDVRIPGNSDQNKLTYV